MEMEFRPATPAERLYTYDQRSLIESRAGSIGHLRGDMGKGGDEFYATWMDHRGDLKTPEFQSELDEVINALRFDESYGGVLDSRTALKRFCRQFPESSFGGESQDFGFRADTQQFSFLFRLNPGQGVYNLYCYCYRRDWPEQHMKNAERGIRFITPNYKELFRIPDGDSIRITHSDGNQIDRVCRYIDDCHLEVGNGLYHICEFAERIERCHSTVIPLRSSLPEKCFSFLDDTGESIIIERGVSGFQHTGQWVQGGFSPEEGAAAFNEMVGTTKAQSAAMKAGAFLGWDKPEADPKNYNEQGQFVKPRQRERER